MYGAAPLCNGRSDGMDYCEAVYPPSSFFKVVQNEVRCLQIFNCVSRLNGWSDDVEAPQHVMPVKLAVT